jgi:hypothetical protein
MREGLRRVGELGIPRRWGVVAAASAFAIAFAGCGGEEPKEKPMPLSSAEVSAIYAKERQGLTPVARFTFDYLWSNDIPWGMPGPTGACLAPSEWDTNEASRSEPDDPARPYYNPSTGILTIVSGQDPNRIATFTGFDDLSQPLLPVNDTALEALQTFCSDQAVPTATATPRSV